MTIIMFVWTLKIIHLWKNVLLLKLCKFVNRHISQGFWNKLDLITAFWLWYNLPFFGLLHDLLYFLCFSIIYIFLSSCIYKLYFAIKVKYLLTNIQVKVISAGEHLFKADFVEEFYLAWDIYFNTKTKQVVCLVFNLD